MGIDRRMTTVTMLTTGIALLLAGSAFVIGDFVHLRGILQRELSATANMLAEVSATALSLRDREAADRTLRALHLDRRIAAASLYLPGVDKAFAGYYRPGAGVVPPDATRPPGRYEEGGSILFIQSVVLNGQGVGTLAIRADRSDFASLLLPELTLAAFVLLPCFGIALLSTSKPRRAFTAPIVRLARRVERIPRDGAAAQLERSHEELSVLSDAFTTLLANTERQETELEAARALHEDDLAQRNAAVESSSSELMAAKNRAEEGERVKGALLAHLSQEVRTPLNGVIAMAQLALETDLTPEQTKYVAATGSSAESLLRVVNDIIDFSRIEAGGLTLERTEFDISETIYEVMREFSPAARQQGLTLLLDIHNDVPSTVMGDPAKFRQIMVNLMDNALKLTDVGNITVEASSVFYSDRVVGLHFQVRDTGRGLTAGQFERALEPFEQQQDSGTWLTGGAGLGLAIANRLIGTMGGCLWLDSEIDSGSTLHFTATFGISNMSASLPLDLNDLRGATVLVADGNAATRRILQQLLSQWQMRPVLAASGPEAIELMRQAMAAGNPFDIALVDRHMLGLDGSEFAREVGERPELGSPVIMVLSSINKVSVTDLTREFCPTGYLVKPVGLTTLLKAVSGAMHSIRGEDRACFPVNKQTQERNAHILVAEDNVTSQTVAVSILMKQGYEVTVARNGIQALEAYDAGGLDMILMDLQMPGMSGLEATRLIRQREGNSGRHIAILALTAHAMTGDRERCLEAGMDDYVSKPIQVRALRTTVSRWLCRGNGRQSEAQTLPETVA
jgi:two-component system sensor histidine kinase/response regulator